MFLSLLVPIVILIAALATLAWLFETDAGLQWAYAQLRARVPGVLEVNHLDGKLAGPIRVADLTYRNEAIDLHLDRAQLDWSPSALLMGRLQIDALSVNGINVVVNETDKPPDPGAGKFGLPLNIGLANVRLERLRIERGRASYLVHSVALAGFLGQQLARVDRLEIDAPNFSVDASGALGLTTDTDRALQVQWQVEPPGKDSIRGSGEISGNLSRLTVTQQIAAPIAVTVRAEIRQPFSDLHWRLDASVPEFDANRLSPIGRALQASGNVEANGGLARFEASGTLRAQTSDLPPLSGSFTLHGTTSGDDINLDQLALRVPDTDLQLTAKARWRPRDTTWTVAAQWQNLRWPLTGEPMVKSPQGMLDADGTYEQYRVRLNLATTAIKVPDTRWRATGSGDRNGVTFTQIAVDTLGSTIQATASASWSPWLRWDAQLNGSLLDPSVTWPDWPGSLAVRASFSGDAGELRANIDSLSGTLRGQTLAVSATAVRRGDDYPQFALKIASGNANAAVSGTLDRQWNLSWQLSAPDLATVLPRAAGKVNGDGRISGARAHPRIEAQISAADLAYEGTRILEASVKAAVDFSDSTRSRASLLVTRATLFNRTFERIVLSADGFRADHSISLDARWAQATLQTELRGAYADMTWSGSLRQSTVRLGSESWTLVEHPKLFFSSNRVALEQTCWGAKNTRACVELQRGAGTPTILSVLAQQLPLALLAPLLPNAPESHGTVSGNARLRFDASRLAQADARLDFSAGEITLVDTPRAAFAYDSAAWQLVVDDHGLRANAAMVLPGGDGGNAEFSMPQFHTNVDIKRQPIKGRLAFTMRDLAPLAALLPQLEDLSGSLQMTFVVTGTLADPRVSGEAAITNAAARIPATGIRIRDVSLAATATGGDELRVSGEAHSGAGQLALAGRVIFPENRAWRAELHVTGEQFHVVDLRENQVFVSPDLQAKLALGEIDVTGEVRLPRASFALRSQKTNVVTTSPDVVIVNAPEGAPTPEPRWKISAQIRVLLGDDVSFSGFGLNAKIAGDVALTEAPTQATTARGQVHVVKGQYDAYGQKLEIERGRLVFVGGPVTNPGIDARAVRKIETITAGVEVKGTLQAPQLTLFSNPAMSQSDALSYMLFGRPLEGASTTEGRSLAAAARALQLAGGERLAQRIGTRFGIEEVDIETGTTQESAALVLGKQLSPRLYINYSIGLFTPENVLRLKYKLSQRWSLETQSGEQAGGDLIFTIEK